MAESSPIPPATSTVTDRRPVPRGALPRGIQTWILAGIAAGMLAIMLLVGRPEPPARRATAAAAPQPPSADRVRDYQDRLRALEAEALRESQAVTPSPDPRPQPAEEAAPKSMPDPLETDRKRRDYESLFASNVVLSRRAERDRPDAGRTSAAQEISRTGGEVPTIDEIADAAARATARMARTSTPGLTGAEASASTPKSPAAPLSTQDQPNATGISGPLHRILEGTIIDTVLANRLDGSTVSPINCIVSNPLYSQSSRHVLIPTGARMLGETKAVQAVGDARLAVAFHRLVMPDGRSYRLDQFTGLNQIGDAGLRDKVNHHYLATFGAAAAVGLISGLTQSLGNVAVGTGERDRTVIIAGSLGDATSQSTTQVMNRFLNRLPTITIREGHRVKVYLTSDLDLPEYEAAARMTPF